jgi:CheY-like chemotaxis protein/signal transduction histidine kinase
MVDDPAKDSFEQELRRALNHLYDPAQLRNSWLAGLLGVKEQDDVVSALRRILISGIEALKPGRDVPAQSNPWRNYQILQHRFVEQFTQREVASSLGLSIRQLRRQEKQAVAELTDYLWIQNDLVRKIAESVPQPSNMDDGVQRDLQTPSRRKELEWSHQSLPNEAVQVKDVILAALEVIRPLADALDVEIVYRIPDELPRLAIQPIPVRQALLNVFSALVPNVRGGRVEVDVHAGHQELRIRMVVQNSVAYPPGTESQDDTGDSLEMARELAEFSGGRLEIDGNLQEGARFSACLTLPTEKQSTVLAIDDNPDTLHLLDRYTAGTAYLFHGERDPRQALALAAELAPDLIVLDVMLPGIDGWDLLGRLHQHPKLAQTRIIVCTILPQAQLALSLGASEFLRKPIDRKTFLSTLDAQMNLLR